MEASESKGPEDDAREDVAQEARNALTLAKMVLAMPI
jgi:hypothetical protein